MITKARTTGWGLVVVAAVAGALLAHRPADAALLGTDAASAVPSAIASAVPGRDRDARANPEPASGLVSTRAVLDRSIAAPAGQDDSRDLILGESQGFRSVLLSTRSVVQAPERALSPRERLLASLEREDMRAGLEAYGVSLEEARARVESLSDGEILQIAGDLDRLPAGGHTPPVETTFVGHPLNPAAWVVNIGKVVVAILTWMFGGGEDGSYDPA